MQHIETIYNATEVNELISEKMELIIDLRSRNILQDLSSKLEESGFSVENEQNTIVIKIDRRKNREALIETINDLIDNTIGDATISDYIIDFRMTEDFMFIEQRRN